MAKKYKLKCFRCLRSFEKKDDVFRNYLNHPSCEDCFYDELIDDWQDDCIDNIINDVKKKFKGNYNNFLNDFHQKYDLCDYCHTYYPKPLNEIDNRMCCDGCCDNMLEMENEVL